GTEGPTGPTGPTGPIFPDSRLNGIKGSTTPQVIPSGGTINQFSGSPFTGLNFDTATGIVTITIPGVYDVECSISVDPSSNVPISFGIVVNNNPLSNSSNIGSRTAGNVISFKTTITLNIGDTIRLQNFSTTPVTLAGFPSSTFGIQINNVLFTVYRIR
ncbi:hypothetical protein CJ999_32915, partial [Bacillus thuringiensis]|nr:hypothetical protein [Bacillus thuringiensis]